ncbi:ribonuclease HI, partial [Phenoliferia sp. Uapishka_3]
MFLSETHAKAGDGARYVLPKGRSQISIVRPLREFENPRGGITCIYDSTLPLTVLRDDICDFLVVRVGTIIILAAYVVPENSPEITRHGLDAMAPLEECLAFYSAICDSVLVIGDINARTSTLSPDHTHLPRASQDASTPATARGRALLDLCNLHGLSMLNGSLGTDAENGGLMTCFAPRGQSVVDYALSSEALTKDILDFEVIPSPTYSDHSVLSLSIRLGAFNLPTPGHAHIRKQKSKVVPPPLVPGKPVDDALREIIEARDGNNEGLSLLYGSIPCLPGPVEVVYTDGSHYPQLGAGIGVWWESSDLRSSNLSEHLPGSIQTNNRAELTAIIRVLERAAREFPLRWLHIFSDSQLIIRSLCHWAPKWSQTGWINSSGKPVQNYDLLKKAVILLQRREAPVKLSYVKAHEGTLGNEEADKLAKAGAAAPPSQTAENLVGFVSLELVDSRTTETVRVSTDLANTTPDSALENLPLFTAPSVAAKILRSEIKRISSITGWYLDSNLRRQRSSCLKNLQYVLRKAVRGHQKIMRDRLLACRKTGQYHSLLKKLEKSSLPVSPVSLPEIETHFRALFQGESSIHFDEVEMFLRRIEGELIPSRTTHKDPNHPLQRSFSIKEIESMKAKLCTSSSTSTGADGESYKSLELIPNEDLLRLVNLILSTNDVCSTWLLSILCPIPKKTAFINVASNSRGISLESCFFKFLTSLMNERYVQWIDKESLLPPTQNGFLRNRRTTNQPKVLRNMIERADASKEELWVAFMDLKKAFDTFLRSAAWAKLARMGAAGPIFDVTRTLYLQMETRIRFQGEVSDAFLSSVGVMQGDPLSSTLWILWMADLEFPERNDDPSLFGCPFSHLIHCDDTALMSKTQAGLQARLDQLGVWCSKNGAIPSPDKTNIVQLSKKKSAIITPFTIYKIPIARIGIPERYIGVLFEEDKPLLFATHHKKQANSGRGAAQTVFGLRYHIGQDDPVLLTQHYKQQVDPILTWAAEVTADTPARVLKQKEKVQISFFRRTLGVHKRSGVSATLAEVGILPLRTRILCLFLRDLVATAHLPRDCPAFLGAMDSATLASESRCGYYYNMSLILKEFDVVLPDLPTPDLLTREWGAEAEDKVVSLTMENALLEIKKPGSKFVCLQRTQYRFQPYLSHPNEKWRHSLTRLRLSCHRFAVEELRYSGISRDMRACRLCNDDVEDEEHVLLACGGHAHLVQLRREFFTNMRGLKCRANTAKTMLHEIYHPQEDTTGTVLRFVDGVTSLFQRYPVQTLPEPSD